MGLDPYAVSDKIADEVVDIAANLPGQIVEDFFDSAEVTNLAGAAEWTRRAMSVADRATAKAAKTLQSFHRAISLPEGSYDNTADTDTPWSVGYAMARNVRHALEVKDTEQFDVSPWVGLGDVSAPPSGIQGFVTVKDDRCGLVLGSQRQGTRFGRARALGRALARPREQLFVLSAARGQDEKVAGAFAAELLAPADGIRESLDLIGSGSDSALEAIARHFKVSPLLVRHQYDNQIATTSHTIW
ncbi:MAG TPA: hypothetical protein VGI74_19095 [Streptosporangiaceae bacterium]